ncbi:hypothetical protein WA026_009989 [Henosepilachna vigintioctopunctata]|uniref:Uncharacterized protein n=1 Tax=Henosepilachna vigintioctopunctata TaxID=420089 RepID=A0AAW1TJD5_9CUCU
MPKLDLTITYDGYKEIGVDTIEDYNAEQQIGVSEIQGLTNFGQKVSGSTAYVRPTFTRLNYNLTLKAFVTKILTNQSTKTAYGVEFVKDRITYQATARKEVIISAGVINTPQLLMLSGIGPSNELAKHNIPVVANLPVGRMFRGNVFFSLFFSVNITAPFDTLEGAVNKFLKGQGVLTSFHNGVTVSFHNTKNNRSSIPNLSLIYYNSTTIAERIPSLTNYTPEVQKFVDKLNFSRLVFTQISLLHPQSIGNITLKSNNPSDFPNINLGIFDKDADIEILYEGIQKVKEIRNTKTIKMLNHSLIKYDFCDEYEYDSKDYWYCALKHLAKPGFQWAGSTKMGPIDDPYAVVDYKLRVHGIKKLRIVDLSAMPVTLSGNYNPSAFMIGEKAADMIKKEYGCVRKDCLS